MATDTTRPNSKAVQTFHTNADTDGNQKSLHHTLGPNHNQSAPGDHIHDGGSSAKLDLPLLGVSLTGSHTTGDLTWRNSIDAALVALGATDATT